MAMAIQTQKELLKLGKKLREIEKIEVKIAAGDKVDHLQLRKFEGKAGIIEEIRRLEDSGDMFSAEAERRTPAQNRSTSQPKVAETAETLEAMPTVLPTATVGEAPAVGKKVRHASRWGKHQRDSDVAVHCHTDAVTDWLQERDCFNLTKGKGKEKARQVQQRRAAAGVILLLGQEMHPKKVIITSQLRRGQPSWELPKGGVENDADLKAAATREFWEETGLTNDLVTLAPLHGYGGRVHWFLAHANDNDSKLIWGPIEDKDTLEARCVTLEEAMRILRDDHATLLRRVVNDVESCSFPWSSNW